MSLQRHDSWPPLIVAADKPGWLRWRDLAITLAMWVAFAIMLESEFELVVGRVLERLGLGDFDTDAHWRLFYERLKPFLEIALVLLVFLLMASVATFRRRHRALLIAPPPALTAAEQARRAGMDEVALLAARRLPNVVVHREKDGSHRIEKRSPPPPA